LSERGRAQCQDVKVNQLERFEAGGKLRPVLTVASPFARTMQTATLTTPDGIKVSLDEVRLFSLP
jgi:broad specificity phosphatase PhoE